MDRTLLKNLRLGDVVIVGEHIGALRYLGPLNTPNTKIITPLPDSITQVSTINVRQGDLWAGIELSEPMGTMDGSIQMNVLMEKDQKIVRKIVRYFSTEMGDNYGVIVPAICIERIVNPWTLLKKVTHVFAMYRSVKKIAEESATHTPHSITSSSHSHIPLQYSVSRRGIATSTSSLHQPDSSVPRLHRSRTTPTTMYGRPSLSRVHSDTSDLLNKRRTSSTIQPPLQKQDSTSSSTAATLGRGSSFGPLSSLTIPVSPLHPVQTLFHLPSPNTPSQLPPVNPQLSTFHSAPFMRPQPTVRNAPPSPQREREITTTTMLRSPRRPRHDRNSSVQSIRSLHTLHTIQIPKSEFDEASMGGMSNLANRSDRMSNTDMNGGISAGAKSPRAALLDNGTPRFTRLNVKNKFQEPPESPRIFQANRRPSKTLSTTLLLEPQNEHEDEERWVSPSPVDRVVDDLSQDVVLTRRTGFV